MKNIFAIFKRDLKKIFTNSMAIVLVVGIIALPSLYAWFNIYANWDPYGKTGNMMVAVCNEDEGTSYKDIEIDIGDEIVSNLKGNSSIDWQFVSKDEAIYGVEAGEYYAAIEIPSGFSKNLASIVTSDYEKPEIIYYANEKKNAIATKITDKVVQTVQLTVNESFITSVVSVMNSVLSTAIDEDDSGEVNSFNYLKEKISSARDTIDTLESSLDTFDQVLNVAQNLNATLNDEDIKNMLDNTDQLISDTENTVELTQKTVDTTFESVGLIMTKTSSSLYSMADALEELGNGTLAQSKASIEQLASETASLKEEVTQISSLLETINGSLSTPISGVDDIIKRLDSVSSSLGTISTLLDNITSYNYEETISDVAAKMRDLAATLGDIQTDYETNIQPDLQANVTSLMNTLDSLSKIVEALSKDSPQLVTMSDAISDSVDAGDSMVVTFSKMLSNMDKELGILNDDIDALSDSEIVNAIINVTGENSGSLGDFLASPVNVTTEKVYGIENYGSAMAPFYSTLAIWVGAMFLAAVVKVDIKKKKEIGPKLKVHEQFFGRGLLYIAFSIIQSLLICMGDLYFLKIQCYDKPKFLFCGVLAGIVFSLFIYSLVFTFGDIGKAVGVILLVIQIGGSGGTFPIDVTQEFFVAVNPYLPFTFVIEAMRETIAGAWGATYWIYLLKLLAYAVAALIIGLPIKFLVKKPIRFFEKKTEETGLF